MKRLFLTQQNFIDAVFNLEPEGPLANHFGIEFRGLEEITHNEDDDGEFAGPQFYKLVGLNYDWNFPKEFPCVVRVLQGDYDVVSMCVYPSDFKLA